ncbi:MAG: succinate dehydrogenase assembly factor 2 [Parvularculaceae bacterium]
MTDPRRKKLLHRAQYRGFREADILIGGYARQALSAMSERELDAFEVLLTLNDHDIYSWIIGTSEPPANIDAELIARMRAFDAAK